ncbi:uncharacterized protein LOC119349580 isoform X1 [Triticum dicoccoides]|uniref:uncharacterized protein LOC119349580 isoform X1 n=1 Tax=Triticum dicoccoides TaxID=85692 RepID=UPI00188E4DD8|nr:uncharacterized protein LOC119349580 isoform X1 [Triticum dicoccoides]
MLLTDVFGELCYTEVFFGYGTEPEKKQLANLPKGHVLTLGLHMYGCLVIQKVVVLKVSLHCKACAGKGKKQLAKMEEEQQQHGHGQRSSSSMGRAPPAQGRSCSMGRAPPAPPRHAATTRGGS